MAEETGGFFILGYFVSLLLIVVRMDGIASEKCFRGFVFVPGINIVWYLYFRLKERKARKLYFLIRDLGGKTVPAGYADVYEAVCRLYDVETLEKAYIAYVSRKYDKAHKKVLSGYL
jgi:hypothetical protein